MVGYLQMVQNSANGIANSDDQTALGYGSALFA